MSTKSKLLQEIAKKAQKIKDKREAAANNSTVQAAVFDFFKNIEESRAVTNNARYDKTVFFEACRTLKQRLKAIDRDMSYEINFSNPEDDVLWTEKVVHGVTITWSQHYTQVNNVDSTLYVDVTDMLLV